MSSGWNMMLCCKVKINYLENISVSVFKWLKGTAEIPFTIHPLMGIEIDFSFRKITFCNNICEINL